MSEDADELPWDDFPEELSAEIPISFFDDLQKSRAEGFTSHHILYQMLPEDDRSLAGGCDWGGVAEEFGVSTKSATKRLQKIDGWGITETDESGDTTTYTIRSDLLDEIYGPEQPTVRPPVGINADPGRHANQTGRRPTLHPFQAATRHPTALDIREDLIYEPSNPTESQLTKPTIKAPPISASSSPNQYANPAQASQKIFLTTLLAAGTTITGIEAPLIGLALLIFSILPLATWIVLATVSHITNKWTDPVDMQTPSLTPT